MKYIFVIGEKEKHQIEVDRSEFSFGKVTVRIDGKGVLEKRITAKGSICELEVGKSEKHNLELKLEGLFQGIKFYVDGRPHLSQLMIPSMEGAVLSLIFGFLIVVGAVGFTAWAYGMMEGAFLNNSAAIITWNDINWLITTWLGFLIGGVFCGFLITKGIMDLRKRSEYENLIRDI